MREGFRDRPAVAEAAVQIARRTGDRARDVSESIRRQVERQLVAIGAPDTWVRLLTEVVPLLAAEREHVFGDDLPAGLRLADVNV